MRKLIFDHTLPASSETLRIYTDELAKPPMDVIGAHNSSSFSRYRESIEGIKEFFGAEKAHFVHSDQEAFSAVMREVYHKEIFGKGKNHLLTLENEGAAILQRFESESDVAIPMEKLPVDEKGHLNIKVLEEAITPRTAMLALSWAHPLTGVIQPLWEIADLCKRKGVLLYVDGSEVVGKLYFRVEDLGIDFFVVDGRAIGSPQGTGVLLSNWDTLQEDSGPGIIAFAHALNKISSRMDDQCLEGARLRDLLESELAGIADILYKKSARLPNISTLAISHIHAELLLNRLASKGFAASLGGGRWQKLEFITSNKSAISIRISPHHTENDILALAKAIVFEAEKLQVGALT